MDNLKIWGISGNIRKKSLYNALYFDYLLSVNGIIPLKTTGLENRINVILPTRKK